MNDLKTIESAIQRLEAMYECNKEVMDADDQGELLTTIKDLKTMKHKLQFNDYIKQVQQFVDYLETAMPDDEAEIDKWLETPYVITQGNQFVTIDNCADFYEGLLGLLKEHLHDYL